MYNQEAGPSEWCRELSRRGQLESSGQLEKMRGQAEWTLKENWGGVTRGQEDKYRKLRRGARWIATVSWEGRGKQ